MVLTVGVVGTGPVGQALGGRLLKKGHTVLYGSRDPASAKAKEVLEQQPTAAVDTIQNVTSASDVILLATPSLHEKAAIESVAAALGPGASKKVVIDATNPFSGWPQLEMIWEKDASGGEILQAALPDSLVFKAFNTIPVEILGSPEALDTKVDLLFAGAKEQQDVVAQVIEDVGFIPRYVGPIRYARNLEAIAELFVHLSVPGIGPGAADWGRNWAFKVAGSPTS